MAANISVYGLYKTREQVEKAVEAFKSAGFRSSDISLLFPDTSGSKDFAFKKGTKMPEGATTGGVSGSVIGGGLGWLTGIGSLAIPGIGPFIAAGPIVAALSGAAIGGSLGWIGGALVGMGIPEYEARRYEGRIKEGGILISLNSDNFQWKDRARELLESTGAEEIGSREEASVFEKLSEEPVA